MCGCYLVVNYVNENYGETYFKEDNVVSLLMKLGSELIYEKTWFHTIEYDSSNLSNSISVTIYNMSFGSTSYVSLDFTLNFTFKYFSVVHNCL